MARHEASDFYGALEVSPRARVSVIDAAYKAIISEVHPDKKGGTHTSAARVNEAYKVLSNTSKRKEYDETRTPSEGKVIGNYRILKEIAKGGFGTTYLGEHIVNRKRVCIKHCHHVSAAYDETLIEEANAIWDLRHFSLPVMRDFIRLEDDSLALVMSYIPGPTLEQIVKKNGRMDPETVAWIAQRVLNALMYLHYHGVVHGDIKPQNIIVQPETHSIVIVDFGLSLVKPTRDTEAKGYTPEFASPEHLNESPLVPESDFYCLGKTLLYALSGSVEAAARMEVPNSVPDPLCKFIKRLLVREVRNRPNWKKEDLCKTIQQVRLDAFGRDHSGMKSIPGF